MPDPINIRGQHLQLLPRAALWIETGTLLIADTHFGKAAAFRAAGFPVSERTTDADLHTLASLLDETSARRLIILGDLLHDRAGRTEDVFHALRTWRHARADLHIHLVRGNHDRSAGDPPDNLDIDCTDQLEDPPFLFLHEPTPPPPSCLRASVPSCLPPRPPLPPYTLHGHVHPAVRLRDTNGSTARFPCFCFGRHTGVLPAFGRFTGLHPIRPTNDDRVFLVTPDGVLPAP